MADNIYTVKQVNSYIKNMFTQDFVLNRLYVKGEVSNCKYHSSGHIYFSLKDESGTMACVMFAGQRSGLAFRMVEGQQVVVLGSVNIYERSGTYQLYAREIRLDGAGVLFEKFQQLKRDLAEMGMFAPEYKRELPFYPQRVGIVTARTGAAIRDIMNIAARRNPYVQLLLYPAQVQGEGAAASIAKGLEVLDQAGVDVIIVGRGGGSIEDLWAFNEERVARAIFDCQTPVVSAVGHETDTTIADFVADLRAPTPSAAAELVIPDVLSLEAQLGELRQRLQRSLLRTLREQQRRVRELQTKLRLLHPRTQLNDRLQFLTESGDKLRRLMRSRCEQEQHRLALAAQRLQGLSPLDKLSRGFSYVTDPAGRPLKSIQTVRTGDALTVYVRDGILQTRIEEIREAEYGKENHKPE